MKIVRFRLKPEAETFYGVLDGLSIKRLSAEPYDGLHFTGDEYAADSVIFDAPCEPSKIVAVGKNYRAHADEMGEGFPPEPLRFLKPSTSVIACGEAVIYPEISHRLDYEGELAVVIGKRAHNVQKGSSAEYIFGYTCLNDVTARDIQKSDPQWTRGKGFDTFCPTGPYIETEFSPETAEITTLLNGKIVQHSPVSAMMHGIDKLVCYITQCMTLLPGDIIATGTPSGIGSMQRGDTVEVRITGLGTLRNIVR